MHKPTEIEIEAAAFRNLVQVLQRRTDVTNDEMMKSLGFCRDCLSHWYQACAESLGLEIEHEQAKFKIYGMSSKEWQDKHLIAPRMTKKQALDTADQQKEKSKSLPR